MIFSKNILKETNILETETKVSKLSLTATGRLFGTLKFSICFDCFFNVIQFERN